jgi:ferrous iron transport protein B
LRIALAGNPNCGKTTLFNALTGLRLKVGNYPGVTVERREGRMATSNGTHVSLLDLPGTYSLSARSVDEQVARDVVLGRVAGTKKPDVLVVVVDASNLERNLYLASQLLDLHVPLILTCNMMDVARARDIKVDLDELSRRLGVPVVGTVGNRAEGIPKLKQAIMDGPKRPTDRLWTPPVELQPEVAALAKVLIEARTVAEDESEGMAILLLGSPDEEELGETVTHLPEAVRRQVREAKERLAVAGVDDPAALLTESRYAFIADLVDAVVTRTAQSDLTVSDKIDRVLTHKVFGLGFFAAIMFVMFLSIFSWADPLMGGIETGQTWVQDTVRNVLPEGAFRDLILDGAIAGVGAVVIFFPQICILFLFIALLEDTGYMARAAFIMDRLMSKVGLHGKSFIPLLSSFACAIPGIMAARTIENRRDRFATILVAPLMSCSARLPVYTVLIAAIFGANAWLKAGIMFSMYMLGIVAALVMATLFKKTLLKGPTPAFIMELPPYRMPRAGAILRTMWDRSKLFLTRAGTTILALSIVLWALAYFPRAEVAADGQVGDQLHGSYLGQAGHWIEPVVKPLGYDWKIGIGLIASFAAREVFVSTMGVVYNVGDEADETSEPLRQQIAGATWPDGSTVYTPLVGIGLMVFYVLACQCVSTIAVVRRETNSWRWPIFMVAYMTGLAYGAALLVYQVGTALGLGGA